MLKLIWISEKEIKGASFKLFKRTSDSKHFDGLLGTEARNIILSESPDFLFVNLKEPVNTDIMERLCISNHKCLRVSVFTFKPFKSKVLNFLLPAEVLQILISGFLKTKHAVRR